VCAVPDGAYCDAHVSAVVPLPSPVDAAAVSVPPGATLVASGLEGIVAVAVDATNVYALASELLAVPKAGGSPVVLARSQGFHLAVDSARAVVSTLGGLSTVPIGGGAVTPLAPTTNLVDGLAIDAANAYYASGDRTQIVVSSVPLGGGAMTTLATAPPRGIDVGTPFESVATDGTNVYFLTSDSVMKVPLSGGAPVALATGQSTLTTIATDGQNVYWAANTAILKVPVGGGTPVTLGQDPNGAPTFLDVDGDELYYVTGVSVAKVSTQGGAIATLVRDSTNLVGGLAVDASSVYWGTGESSGSNAAVFKIPK
jgi:hypothetical protein